jgi:uncharacterized MAPEG superfamily protein
VTVTPELASLAVISTATALMWVPYVVARIFSAGLTAAFGVPGPGYPTDAPWADRARRAHVNAVENLAVFAPLILTAAISGVSTPATVLASRLYVAARMAHYLIYVAGIPLARTVAFLIGSFATLVVAEAILRSAF